MLRQGDEIVEYAVRGTIRDLIDAVRLQKRHRTDSLAAGDVPMRTVADGPNAVSTAALGQRIVVDCPVGLLRPGFLGRNDGIETTAQAHSCELLELDVCSEIAKEDSLYTGIAESCQELGNPWVQLHSGDEGIPVEVVEPERKVGTIRGPEPIENPLKVEQTVV